MRWNWTRRKRRSVVVISWTGSALAYVQARGTEPGGYQVVDRGVVQRGADGQEAFADRLAELGFKGCAIRVMLRPDQYQLLQVEAPQVPSEEIRAATRWKIRDLVEAHVDDLTLDVCRVGDVRVRDSGQLFVVVARNALIREMAQICEFLQGQIEVIDVWDMAQRNLQSLFSGRKTSTDRADAALVLVDASQAILTISSGGELFYSRRIELAPSFAQGRWVVDPVGVAPAIEPLGAVPEYVPSALAEPFSLYDDAALDVTADPGEGAQRFVVEVQRSLDVWERTWSQLPLDALRVFAGARTQELATWLGRELGTNVQAMEIDRYFPGFSEGLLSDSEQSQCWPLLGILLRPGQAQA